MHIMYIIKQAKQALILFGPSACNFSVGMLLEKGVVISVTLNQEITVFVQLSLANSDPLYIFSSGGSLK